MKGWIHSFESMAAVDGQGVRCAVFLCGCPLRCVYCHNPDTWFSESGEEIKGEELVRKISRFRPYFGENGGVTFSGGEPLVQAKFLCSLIPLLKKEKISYILDTSGAVALTDSVRKLVQHADSVILDLKFWDDASYQCYTGHGIGRTLDFLNFLESIGKRTMIRTVIVPGINDREEILEAYLELLCGKTCMIGYELLPFHTMGFLKYDKMNLKNPLIDKKAMSGERLEELQKFINLKRNGNG